MKYICSLSGGVASAVATDRAIQRYGRENVTLWFADTSWEDPDLYRFLDDLMQRWGGDLIRYKDGRTPLQIAETQNIIPNSRIAPCTKELKIFPFRRYLKTVPKPVTVLLGLDWKEQHRHEGPRRNYESIEGVTVDYPLMWKPFEHQPYQTVVFSWGIKVPVLYALGWGHNNCGGRCVKQGMKDWLRLRQEFPERFNDVRDWETQQREIGDARKDYTILKVRKGGVNTPITLVDLVKERVLDPEETGQDDLFSCFCSY